MKAVAGTAPPRSVTLEWIAWTPETASLAVSVTATSPRCQPASVATGVTVATVWGASLSAGGGKSGAGTASRPVNQTSTNRCPGRTASSPATVRDCPVASNQYGSATAVSASSWGKA